jgi:hypothetical protein
MDNQMVMFCLMIWKLFMLKHEHEQKQCSPRLEGENVPTSGLKQVTSPNPRKWEAKQHNH